MQRLSLGLIETAGLASAIEAADAAVKSANVKLVGYELTRGDGMTVVKVVGDVGAVKAAISAASAAAAKVSRVVSTRVIARPAEGIDMLVVNPDTVGIPKPEPIVETPLETAAAPEIAPAAEAGIKGQAQETDPGPDTAEKVAVEEILPEQVSETERSGEDGAADLTDEAGTEAEEQPGTSITAEEPDTEKQPEAGSIAEKSPQPPKSAAGGRKPPRKKRPNNGAKS